MQTDTAPGGVCSHRQSQGYASDPISKVSLSWQGGRRAFTVSSPGHADSPASSTAKRAGAVLGDDRKYIPGHCRFATWNWSLCFLFAQLLPGARARTGRPAAGGGVPGRSSARVTERSLGSAQVTARRDGVYSTLSTPRETSFFISKRG